MKKGLKQQISTTRKNKDVERRLEIAEQQREMAEQQREMAEQCLSNIIKKCKIKDTPSKNYQIYLDLMTNN